MTAYVSADQLKATLNIGSTYADADVEVSVDAASRACDGYKNVGPGMFATTASQTRYYSTDPCESVLPIDPLNTLTTLKVDTDGNGTYETTWTNATDFILTPDNAALDGFPYTEVKLLRQAGRVFPPYLKSVQIVGLFGWAATPAAVTQAATILAGRLLKRSRETPYGIVVVAGDAVAAARLGRIDPDVAFLLDNLPGSVPLLAI